MKIHQPRLIVGLLVAATAIAARPQPAAAQRGQILGEILRNVGEIAAESERRKRIEEQRRLQEIQQFPRPPQTLPIDLPPGVLARPPIGGGPPVSSINVGSRESAQFIGDLVSFRQTIDGLVADLQNRSAPRPMRLAIPELVQLSAQAGGLIERSAGLLSPTHVAPEYQPIDAQFRTIAYRLRPYADGDSAWSSSLNELQRLADSMTAATGTTPGFDHPALRRLMHSASAHLLDLLDDMELARRTSVSDRVAHQLRVLQQRLVTGAESLESLPPQEIVARYNGYIGEWSSLAAELSSMRDPHIDLRVERIRQVGLETHRVLRIDPPREFVNLPSVAQNLYRDADRLADRLTLGGLRTLPIDDQLRALRLARDFEMDCRQLSQLGGGDYRPAMATAVEHWQSLRPIAQRLPSIDQPLLTSIDRHLGELGGPTYTIPGGGMGGTFDPRSLASLAATVEGGTDTIRRDIDQIDGRIRSSTYRNQLNEEARESYRHAKRLHDELTERRPDRDDIDREVRQLAEHWQVAGTADRRAAPAGGQRPRRAADPRSTPATRVRRRPAGHRLD